MSIFEDIVTEFRGCFNPNPKQPDFNKRCSDTYVIENLCYSLRDDQTQAFQKCVEIDGNEWVFDTFVGDCFSYEDNLLVNRPQNCTGRITTRGRQIRCRRYASRGEPLECCLKNINNCTSGNCFDSNDNTCADKYRDITTNDCIRTITDYCTLKDVSNNDYTTEFQSRWNNVCESAIWKIAYSGTIDSVQCSGNFFEAVPVTNPTQASKILRATFDEFKRRGGSFLDPSLNSSAFLEVQNILFGICQKSPILCYNYFENECVSQLYNDILINPELRKWCGCAVSSDAVDELLNNFGLAKECLTTCNDRDVLQIPTDPSTYPQIQSQTKTNISEDGFQKQVITIEQRNAQFDVLVNFHRRTCQTSTCIIDNLSLNIFDSEINNLQFDQVCPSCSFDDENITCSCTILNNTITTVSSEIPNFRIRQNCTRGSDCVIERDGELVSVPCNNGIPGDELFNQIKERDEENKNLQLRSQASLTNSLFLLFIVVLFILVIILMIFFIIPSKTKKVIV
ncbi:MAG: hypothetical protein WBA74_01880 [Cyclobacteriaceae bacterium]